MTLEFTEQPTVSTQPLDVELWTLIYWLIKSSWNVSKAIEASIYDPENIIKIWNEVERIVSLRWQTYVSEVATYDEEWNVLTEEVRLPVEIISDIIDVEEVLEDFPLETNNE